MRTVGSLATRASYTSVPARATAPMQRGTRTCAEPQLKVTPPHVKARTIDVVLTIIKTLPLQIYMSGKVEIKRKYGAYIQSIRAIFSRKAVRGVFR